jgi:hypothetical protein
VKASYTEEKSRQLGRRDIVEYYAASLENVNPDLVEKEPLKSLREGLVELLPLVDVPEGKALTVEEVAQLNKVAKKMASKL